MEMLFVEAQELGMQFAASFLLNILGQRTIDKCRFIGLVDTGSDLEIIAEARFVKRGIDPIEHLSEVNRLEAQKALDSLHIQIVNQGWRRIADGPHWYSRRYEREGPGNGHPQKAVVPSLQKPAAPKPPEALNLVSGSQRSTDEESALVEIARRSPTHLSPGTYDFGPHNGQMLVKTFVEGLGRRSTHDLVIEVKNWDASAFIAEIPQESTFSGWASVDSFEVVRSERGVKPLSQNDKVNILRHVRQTLTKSSIMFQSTSVHPSTNTVTGDMSIMGKSVPVDITLFRSGRRVAANMTLVQSKWGIRLFTAMMGALRVADEVEVEIIATIY
jgi:polyisoprenoid-binding protein YceI